MNSTERFCRFEASVEIAGLQRPRQFGQKHDGDRDADHAERQLVDAVGEGERRRPRPVLAGCDRRADQRVDLRDAAGDRRRQRQPQQPLHVGRQARPAETDRHAGMAHRHPDDGKLHDARRQHAPGERVTDCRAVHARVPGIGQHPDQDDVEEYRRDRGGEIAPQRIQHAGHHRAERHADQIGEHDGGERHRHRQLFRARRRSPARSA